MLAIFHFGHPDVFPSADGSIARASALVTEHLAPTFDPGRAAPNRTLLAAYLWASLDRGYWSRGKGEASPGRG